MFDIAGVSGVVMTNDPLDEAEGEIWKNGVNVDQRFKSVVKVGPPAETISDLGIGPNGNSAVVGPVDSAPESSLPGGFRYRRISNSQVMTSVTGCCEK